MKENYIQICLRHMGFNDNCFLLWNKGNAGYIRSVEDAEITTLDMTIEDTQKLKDDFYVKKCVIDRLKQKVRLPIYGDKIEKYGERNEFYVLPNTGQVRKELGINSYDIPLDGNRNSFDCSFSDTVIEVFKWEYSKTEFRVRAKETVSEFWYMDGVYQAENRNKAILKAFNDWIPDDYDNYIEFKKDMLCSRSRKRVFDKWKDLK